MKTKTESWKIAAGVSVLLLAVLRLMPDLWTRTPRNFAGLLVWFTLGLVWGSHGLLSAYWAAGRGNLVRRTAVVALLFVVVWFLEVLALKNTRDSFESGWFSQAVAVSDLATFVPTSALVAVFFFLKRGFASPPNFVAPPRQFTLSDLFLLTVAAAILSLIARSPVGRELWRSDGVLDNGGHSLKTLIEMSLVVGLGELIVSLPFAWLLFGRKPLRIRLSIASMLTPLGVTLVCSIYIAFESALDGLKALLTTQLGIWTAYGVAALSMRSLWDDEPKVSCEPADQDRPVAESCEPNEAERKDSPDEP